MLDGGWRAVDAPLMQSATLYSRLTEDGASLKRSAAHPLERGSHRGGEMAGLHRNRGGRRPCSVTGMPVDNAIDELGRRHRHNHVERVRRPHADTGADTSTQSTRRRIERPGSCLARRRCSEEASMHKRRRESVTAVQVQQVAHVQQEFHVQQEPQVQEEAQVQHEAQVQEEAQVQHEAQVQQEAQPDVITQPEMEDTQWEIPDDILDAH
nr:uncharacterized protein LOC109167506 [Ipomoea trifida]